MSLPWVKQAPCVNIMSYWFNLVKEIASDVNQPIDKVMYKLENFIRTRLGLGSFVHVHVSITKPNQVYVKKQQKPKLSEKYIFLYNK